jgi:Recombination endonuclease VII
MAMRGNGRQPEYIEPGTQFGYFTVIEEAPRRQTAAANLRYMRCRCICGEEREIFLGNLKARKTVSCGCAHSWGETGRAIALAQRRAISEESDEGRICLTCNTWKPWDRFSNDQRRARGKASNCMQCGAWRVVKATYGITRDEWGCLLADQRGGCALCQEPDVVDGRKLSIDHDHACCGRVRACKKCIRGLLCSTCNRLLGHVEARPRLADRFADYLKQRPFSQ